MSPIITVKNIGKRYTISHQGNKRANTLRDEMEGWFKNLTRKRLKEELPSKEEFWALKDVSFDIEPGDRVGIIGRNGAGKSTLLKILSRITEPTTGEIRIKGRVASLLEVGTGFHPELSGRENVYLNGAILGMSRVEIKKKFDEIVAFSEVEKFLDTPVKRYSSGMYVRLAFAVAAHLEPEILIVDEVLSVGDAQFQKKSLGKMEEVGKEGRTVLFVSHNMGAVQSLCSRAVVLNQGCILFDGEANKGIEFYNSICSNAITQAQIEDYNHTIVINKCRVSTIEDTEILSGSNIPIGNRIKIFINFLAKVEIRSLSFSIDIVNSNGELFSHLTNEDGQLSIDSLQKGTSTILEITTAAICFIPGKYTINLWVGFGHDGEACYRMTNAFSFFIEQGSYVKRTRSLPKHAKIYLSSTWKIL
jgi:lipopolysaccharide transport system ATP-binding protein